VGKVKDGQKLQMTLGFDTFSLNKTQFNEKLSRIITNFRASSKLVGEPREFILRCCRLTEKWSKLANDSDVEVYLRNVDTAGGRKIKMISLERGTTKQPVPKAKLTDSLYPVKKIATTATIEEKHLNAVKAAMRHAIKHQLKEFRSRCEPTTICYLTGLKLRPGSKADVDHIGMPFSEIADKFLQSQNLRYTDITLKGPPTAKVFTDTLLWVKWIDFHAENAKFALVCSSANRSKGSDGYSVDPALIGSFQSEDPEILALDF
jgi:hypothetical protein